VDILHINLMQVPQMNPKIYSTVSCPRTSFITTFDKMHTDEDAAAAVTNTKVCTCLCYLKQVQSKWNFSKVCRMVSICIWLLLSV